MEFDESKQPRGVDGKFTAGRGEVSSLPSASKVADSIPQRAWEKQSKPDAQTMSSAEKIASVHIDRTRDNVLPELGDAELKSIGATESKPVLVKKRIIDRNAERHKEISDKDFETIIATALYDSPEVFRASSSEPYYHFAKFVEYGESGSLKMGLCLLDVNESKDHFEVVHAYVVNGDKFEESKNISNKK